MRRRPFLRASAAAAAAGLACPAFLRSATPNASVVLGIIGTSRGTTGTPGRGTELALGLAAQPNVEVAWLCDVDAGYLAKAMEGVTQKGQRPKAEHDFRRVLEDPRVQAVVIATPDHWHVPMALLALAAGKHVYLETPCGHNAAEGVMLQTVAQKHGLLVQHGLQRRSWPALQEAMEKLRTGVLGRLISAKAIYYAARPTVDRGVLALPPTGLDWALWQGPAPERPYQSNYLPHNWRWFWHWGTGELGNSGVHLLDLCRWGLNLKVPMRISCGGVKSRYPDDQETPDQQTATFDFSGEFPLTISWESRSWAARTLNDPKYDVAFYGEGGSLVVAGSAYSIHDLAGRELSRGAGAAGTDGHLRNFIEGIRGTAKLTAPLEEGIASSLMCHLGNISWRTNHTVLFNPTLDRIVNDLDAAALWERKYQDGWTPAV